MSWSEIALWWLPTAAVVATAIFAFVMAAIAPARAARKYWMTAALLVGAAAIGVTAWRQDVSRVTLGAEAARLRGLGSRLDALGRMLPAGPGKTEDETFDTVAAALRSLSDKVKDLAAQVDTLRQKTRFRTIDPKTAGQLADDLHKAGSYRVVVSCAPDDVEAFAYANQIANMLRAAGWQAPGPETTAIFGEAPSMGIELYVRDGTAPPEAAKLLQDALTRFNIPFKPGVTPSNAIPDPATTELFVSHKP